MAQVFPTATTESEVISLLTARLAEKTAEVETLNRNYKMTVQLLAEQTAKVAKIQKENEMLKNTVEKNRNYKREVTIQQETLTARNLKIKEKNETIETLKKEKKEAVKQKQEKIAELAYKLKERNQTIAELKTAAMLNGLPVSDCAMGLQDLRKHLDEKQKEENIIQRMNREEIALLEKRMDQTGLQIQELYMNGQRTAEESQNTVAQIRELEGLMMEKQILWDIDSAKKQEQIDMLQQQIIILKSLPFE